MSKTLIYVGLDNTDNHTSRGTGNLARRIAGELAADYFLVGVTRHQLLLDPRVPCTANNSSAVICLGIEPSTDLESLFDRVRTMILADLQSDSDPGLCLADENVARQFSDFGRRAKRMLVTQAEARALAHQEGALLEGLDGTQDGVIGALAAVGLAACCEDGRYIMVGRSRQLSGLQPISTIQHAGIPAIRTLDGKDVEQGSVLSDKLRPARRGGQPVLFVEWHEPYWLPLKLD